MRISLLVLLFLLPSLSFALCVREDKAKLYYAPKSSKVTWEVFRYMPLEKLSKQGGWYRVKDVDGEIHWINEEAVTNKFECAVIKDEFAYLRSGPGREFPKVKASQGEKYLSFRILEEKKGWVKVEDAEGDSAWIKRELIWRQ